MLERPRAAFGAIAKTVLAAALPAALGLCLALASTPAAARGHHHYRHHRSAASLTWPHKYASLILDGETGKVLYARNAEALRYPASLTKLMTLYLLFDALKKGQLSLQTPMTVSAHAAGQAPVKLYMRPGSTITVEQAIKAIVVRSANDVAVVIAEKLGGTESHFARMMTAEARKLGMDHTHYVNASGLPNRGQTTTASDLGLLARHVAYDFPQYFHFFSTRSFTFHGHTWPTHDNLIGHYKGADGMKTGFTVMSGFNLVSSVVRNGVHIIGVVMGGRTAHKRDEVMIALLNQTFARIKKNPTMVAHAQVPWHAIGRGQSARTVIAGFDIGSGPASANRHDVIASVAPHLRPADAVDPNNEDAAESRADTDDSNDQDEIAALIAPRPRPKTAIKATIASYERPSNVPVPAPRTVALRGSGAVAPSAMKSLGLRDWTIQIGAYANPKVAKQQLAAYARKSTDILGEAERIVVPFRGVDGHTLYRARFGPYAENEARKVCQRLTERGQTCFAATATR